MAEPKKNPKRKAKSKKPEKATGTGLKYVIYLVIAVVAVVAAITLVRDSGKPATNSSTGGASTDNMLIRLEFQREAILSFFDPGGQMVATIDAELAENDDERARGLMFRDQMEMNQGMLFIFPYEIIQSFWMKNTILPLDMIFVNASREIVTIHKNTTPYAETSYRSSAPAKYVVEVNAGYTDRYGIREGYRINWVRAD